MNYMKKQVRRMSRNRMILFFILAAYSSIFILVGLDLGARSAARVDISMALFGAVPTGTCLLFVVGNLISLFDYTKSKAFKRLGRFGSNSAETINMLLSHEVETTGFINKWLMLGERWICVQSAFSVRVYPCEWLVWAYVHIRSDRSRTLTGKEKVTPYYAVALSFSDGKKKEVGPGKQLTCYELLDMISQKYPHVLIGYKDELLSLYKRDMNGFIKHVASIKGVSDHV